MVLVRGAISMMKKASVFFGVLCLLSMPLILIASEDQPPYPNVLYGQVVDTRGERLPEVTIEVHSLDFVEVSGSFCAVERIFMEGTTDEAGWFMLEKGNLEHPRTNFLAKVTIHKGEETRIKYLSVNAVNHPPIKGIQELVFDPEQGGAMLDSEWVAINRDPGLSAETTYKSEAVAGEVIKVIVETQPSDARVKLNGVEIGNSGITFYVDRSGNYEIELEKGGLSSRVSIDDLMSEETNEIEIIEILTEKKQ